MKQIEVRIKFGKNPQIIERNGVLEIKINVRPEKGKANKQIINLVAKHFQLPKNSISIVKGIRSRHKIIKCKN